MTGTHLVRRLPGRVAAYDLATGAVAWELPLSGAEIDNCPSSQQQSRNRVALLRAGGDGENECGSVTVLDISTGDEVFTTELPPIDRKNVAVGDDQLLAKVSCRPRLGSDLALSGLRA